MDVRMFVYILYDKIELTSGYTRHGNFSKQIFQKLFQKLIELQLDFSLSITAFAYLLSAIIVTCSQPSSPL